MALPLTARCRAIFDAVIDLPAAERARAVDIECDGDPALRAIVRRLLAADAAAGGFLRPLPDWKANDAIESQVGEYTLIRKLGEGGMGQVYLAEPGPVAVKLIRRDLDSDAIRRRFHRERESLARLDHPGIAKLLDGGTTASGTPYLVLAYVDGEPLDELCRIHRPNLRARIELFQSLCRAISFAHQRFVIHRDLKPANVLVTRDGRPVVLDFGLAKLMASNLEQALSSTRTGQRLLTPEYASPEQLTGGRMSPAVDVYALGLLLYELVAGVRAHRFVGRSLPEMVRMVCEHPVPPPSAVTVFDWRDDLLRALDRIVLKAIAKAPDARYRHVEEIEDDLRRHMK
jgi:serine/threonine protein kinase